LQQLTPTLKYEFVSPIIAGFPLVQENIEFYHAGECTCPLDSQNASKKVFQQASGKPAK